MLFVSLLLRKIDQFNAITCVAKQKKLLVRLINNSAAEQLSNCWVARAFASY